MKTNLNSVLSNLRISPSLFLVKKLLFAGVTVSLCSLATADPTIAADGINFGTANDDPLLRKDPDGSKELHLDVAENGAFSIFSGLEMRPSFKAGQGHSASVTAGRWYRIAKSNNGANLGANALFNLRDMSSNAFNNITFRTGMAFGEKTKMSLTLLSNSAYNSPVFEEVRYLSSGDSNEFYLEVKITRDADVSYSIMDNLAKDGWQPVDWVETTEIPAGYTSTSYFLNKLFVAAGETPVLSVDRTEGVAIEGGLTVGGVIELGKDQDDEVSLTVDPNGAVILNKAQGDISMGAFGQQ